MKQLFPLLFAFVLLMSACGPRKSFSADDIRPAHKENNAVYYWKTSFSPDSLDRAFIREHNIGRIYLRMFDVAEDAPYSPVAQERVVPNATVRISDKDYAYLKDSLSHIEFVPVVYITLEALKAMKGEEGELASAIVTRLDNMCVYNGLPGVEEMQLDCDWTESTESSFFALCDSVKRQIKQHGLEWRLSSTIRLHQLSRAVPPVDNGVLMVYNTGSFDNPDANNSIIDKADVEPYLCHLANYPLHLDVAYPTYSWQLLFRNRKFVGLLNGLDINDRDSFAPCGPNRFVAVRAVPYRDLVIHEGDVVRTEISDIGDINAVKNMIEDRMTDREHSNILYHLDSKNLSKYSDDEITSLYSTAR